MQRRWSEVKVGLLVAVGLALIAALILNSANWRRGIGGKALRAKFSFVANLQPGAPVHMNGVQIGKVTGINLLEEGVEVRMRVKSPIPLRKGCVASIGFLGVVGETYVEIENGPVGNPPVEDNELIEGRDPTNTAMVLRKAEEAARIAAEVVRSTLDLVNALRPKLDRTTERLSESVEGMRRGLDELNRTLASLRELSGELQTLIAQNRRELKRIIARADELTAKAARDYEEIESHAAALLEEARRSAASVKQEVGRAAGSADEAFGRLEKLSAEVEGAIDRIQRELLASIGELKGEAAADLREARDLLKDIRATSSALRGAAAGIDGLLKELEEGGGTAGKLISSDETIRKAHSALEELEGAARSVSRALESFRSDYNLIGGQSLRWGAGFRYVNLPGSFRSNISLRLGSLMAGITVEGGRPKLDLQYVRPISLSDLLLRVRIGSLRSKAGLGLDLWPVRWIGLSTELIDTGGDRPRVDSFLSLKLYENWHLIFGGEDLLNRRGITFGVIRSEVR